MRAEGRRSVPHAWVSAPWAGLKPLQGSPAQAQNLLGFGGADGLGRKGAPGARTSGGSCKALAAGPQLRAPGRGSAGCWQRWRGQGQRAGTGGAGGATRESRRPQEALSAAPWPGVLMEQAGSGRSLLTSPPSQDRIRKVHPTPLADPQRTRRQGDAGPGKVKLMPMCLESGQNGSSRLASLLSSLMERHCSALGTPASLLTQ